MKQTKTNLVLAMALITLGAVQCSQPAAEESKTPEATLYGGKYATEVEWGEHLVRVGGCGDCHTPKKMGPNGPVHDSSLLLSGHPAQMPPPPIDQKEAAAKGLGHAFLGRIPLDLAIRQASDAGTPPAAGEGVQAEAFAALARQVADWLDSRPGA